MIIGEDYRILDFADDFVLSSGTITVDCSRCLVLLLYFTPKGEYLRPKGRKDVGETLPAAAVRETTEESGYHCQLLEHSLTLGLLQPDLQHTLSLSRSNSGSAKMFVKSSSGT